MPKPDGWLNAVVGDPTMAAASVGEAAVAAYQAAGPVDGTLSTVALGTSIGSVADAVNVFTEVALTDGDTDDWQSFAAARNAAYEYGKGETPAIRDAREFFDGVAWAADMTPAIAAAAGKAAASERSHWALFDDFNARNATAAFSEIEWE